MSSEHVTYTLANGTHVSVGAAWACTTLPGGQQVHAHPDVRSADMARQLGYGQDTAAMTREHDLLHSLLMEWLEQPHSHSLHEAAGLAHVPQVSWEEENTVLALQKLLCAIRAAGGSWQPRYLPAHPSTPPGA